MRYNFSDWKEVKEWRRVCVFIAMQRLLAPVFLFLTGNNPLEGNDTAVRSLEKFSCQNDHIKE